MAERTEADIHQTYLKYLEDRLKSLKNPDHQPKAGALLDELAKTRDQQLYDLITGRNKCFEDDATSRSLSATWLQRKVAPQTVAVNTQELVELVKHDVLEKAQVADIAGTVLKQDSEDDKEPNTSSN